IRIMNAPSDYDIEILTRELTVTVLGPEAYIEAMSALSISVTLDLAGIEILSETKTIQKTVQCRIIGRNVPAWVVGYPMVDIQFTRL
ncbi:MAG: hypothetical protein FWG44_08800, partial [Oscillospiraceae bacterium]|nr:hypothetical protein [Oscillospiraceae bacterium]